MRGSRSSLSKKQQRNVAALMQFVSCSERDAIALLRECNWGVHEAAERFFAQQAANAVDTEAVDAWFGKYVEEGSGAGRRRGNRWRGRVDVGVASTTSPEEDDATDEGEQEE